MKEKEEVPFPRRPAVRGRADLLAAILFHAEKSSYGVVAEDMTYNMLIVLHHSLLFNIYLLLDAGHHIKRKCKFALDLIQGNITCLQSVPLVLS